ncbi:MULTISPECIES: FxLYD domain-containing protein [Salinibaculum]|uniref:FxLYD domain-containing protein n=1 Tax=Salinibaculum TaxID=2732368 RepID=UPI0030CECF65
MKRRSFLLMSAFGLAGCTGTDTEATETPTSIQLTEEPPATREKTSTAADFEPPTQTQTETPTETEAVSPTETDTETEAETATRTPAPDPGQIEVVETTLFSDSAMFGPDKYAQVDIENQTTNIHGYAEVHVDFLNADGESIDTDRTNILAIPGESTWRAYLEYYGDQTVDEIDGRIVDQSRRIPITSPDGATVTESGDIRTSLDNPQVNGTIEVTEAFDFLEVLAPFYDTNGYLRQIGRDTESHLTADMTWKFTADATLDPPDDAAGISDYELLLTTD